MDYTTSLNLLKDTLLGGSERDILIEAITAHFVRKKLSWLDIGIGDGISLRKTLARLSEQKYELSITGIDPLLMEAKQIRKILPEAELLCDMFENYTTNETFDVVNATQSLYYMRDKNYALGKMTQLTAGGGLIVATVCATDCILTRIHHELFGGDSQDWITAEDVYRLLRTIDRSLESEIRYFRGSIDIAAWKASTYLLNAACTVLTRHLESVEGRSNTVTKLSEILNKFNDIEERVNGIVIAKKY